MKKIIFIAAALLLSACAANDTRDIATIGFTYATVKQIESGKWTADRVLDEVARIRAISETTVEIDTYDIVNSVIERAGIESSADRYLVAQFLGSLQSYVLQVEAGADRLQRLSVVLDAVEQGALFAQ